MSIGKSLSLQIPNWHRDMLCKCHVSVTDPGFPGGVPTYYLGNFFAENWMEITEIGSRRTCIDSDPLGSSTVFYTTFAISWKNIWFRKKITLLWTVIPKKRYSNGCRTSLNPLDSFGIYFNASRFWDSLTLTFSCGKEGSYWPGPGAAITVSLGLRKVSLLVIDINGAYPSKRCIPKT